VLGVYAAFAGGHVALESHLNPHALAAAHPAAAHAVAKYGPALVGLITMGESMGIPLPAESALITASVFAGTTHKMSIYLIVACAAGGAIIGDNLGYLIGRTVGYAVLRRYGHYVGLTPERLLLGRYLFKHHGSAVVLFGRFVALLRTLAAMLAGAMHMPYPKLLVANAIGGIGWACLYGFGAYALGARAHHIAGPFGLILAAIAAVVIIGGIVFMRRNESRMIDAAKAELGSA
jgi:membrane protein DedA with SNARE-associated domain